jgi:BASS family bile acid:Na+ symporter
MMTPLSVFAVLDTNLTVISTTLTSQQSDAVEAVPEEEEKTFGAKAFDVYTKTANIATNLFPLWTIIFTAWALKKPQDFAWFTTKYFTAGLAALMLSMGITLTPKDFVEVASEPKSVLMQFSLCYLMMPALAFGLGKAAGLSPALLAGMVLVGSINGGQASNLCTYIAKGNVALSVLMTTATTIGAIFMTPLICKGVLGTVVPVDAVGIAMSTLQVCSFLL